MNEWERTLRRFVNPVSTGLTGAWCRSPILRWARRHEVGPLLHMPRFRRAGRGTRGGPTSPKG
ncbi:MAG TPA: hypothetical protein VMV53_08660 [Acidimicrobiales bacterium]|nr:hypothetical protein [Acidimicrobiales bacterium]